MIMNKNSKGGSNNPKALTVIMPNNSSNPKPIAPKVPGSGNAKSNKNHPAAPARYVKCEGRCTVVPSVEYDKRIRILQPRRIEKNEKCGWAQPRVPM